MAIKFKTWVKEKLTTNSVVKRKTTNRPTAHKDATQKTIPKKNQHEPTKNQGY